MRRITPQPPRTGFDVAIEFLRRVQTLMRSKDHLCRRRRQTAFGPLIPMFRPRADGVAVRRAITLGASSVTHVEVLEGLAVGESVVIAGTDTFDDAERVQLND